MSKRAHNAITRYLTMTPQGVSDEDLEVVREEASVLLRSIERNDNPPDIFTEDGEAIDAMALGGILGGVKHEMERRHIERSRDAEQTWHPNGGAEHDDESHSRRWWWPW